MNFLGSGWVKRPLFQRFFKPFKTKAPAGAPAGALRRVFLKGGAALACLCLAVALQSVFLKNPGRMRYMFKTGPKVFGEITVQLLKNDVQVRAVAKREDGRLKLEIFQGDGKGRKINEKIIGRYPAFIEYQGEGVFLQAVDYDGDGALELAVSSMDSRFRPRLYILRFNKARGVFEEMNLYRADFL